MQAQRTIVPGGSSAGRIVMLPVASVRMQRALPVPAAARPRRPLCVVPVASVGGLSRPAGEDASGTDGGQHAGPSRIGPFMSVPNTVMAKGGPGNMGSGSALGAVLERNRVNIVMPTPPQQGPRLDDGGDGGGMGKNNHNGGGGGDGGGGDDDDYFGEEGDGEGEGGGGGGWGAGGGIAWLRAHVPELFDRAAIGAVLQEWYKTIADLPLFIRRSVEMGLYSSAQLVRFLSMDVRPGMTRAVSRALPTSAAREFVGRLMADPAFCQKLVIEQTLAFSASMLHEWRVRGDAFRNELDLAVINSMGLAAAVGGAVWITAPSRAFGAAHKFPWQKMLAGLPQCVFDAAGPLRSYSPAARVGGFFASMAQLSAVGAAAGAATSAASSLAIAAHRRTDPTWEPSVPVPDISRASGGLGAFFALNANVRYQLLGGLDRYLFSHASALWTYVGLTAAARVGATAAGEITRPFWQGLATETAASHLEKRTRVRKVRRRVVKKQQQPAEGATATATADPTVLLAGAADPQQAAFAALAVGAAAAAVVAGDAPSSSGGAAEEQQQDQQQRWEAAAAAGPSGAAAAPAGSLEAEVEERLGSAPALMGSPETLAQLARGGASMPDESTMGEAMRDALETEAVA